MYSWIGEYSKVPYVSSCLYVFFFFLRISSSLLSDVLVLRSAQLFITQPHTHPRLTTALRNLRNWGENLLVYHCFGYEMGKKNNPISHLLSFLPFSPFFPTSLHLQRIITLIYLFSYLLPPICQAHATLCFSSTIWVYGTPVFLVCFTYSIKYHKIKWVKKIQKSEKIPVQFQWYKQTFHFLLFLPRPLLWPE